LFEGAVHTELGQVQSEGQNMTSWKAEGSYEQHSDTFTKRLMLRCSYKVQLYQHAHLVHADKVFKFRTSIKQITSCVKMMWHEEKCAQDFGGET
jgi:hypothetical protein